MKKLVSMKFLAIFLVTFLIGIDATTSSASAHEISKSISNFKVETNNKGIDVSFVSNDLKIDKGHGVSIKRPKYSIKSNFNVSGDRMNFTDTLTSTDTDDFWFFSVDTERSVIFNIQSTNPDYAVELYQIDWETGTAYPTSLGGYSGDEVAYNQLPSGDWALRVYTTGTTYGDSYSIKMNATNPSGAANILSESDSLLYVVLSYPNGDIYSNGTYVATIGGDNTHLNWKREYYFTWDGNYDQRTHEISEVKIKSISGPVSYHSDYASSDNAILIYLDEGTLFMYNESSFRSGPPTQYTNSFVDTIGKTTPRRLDSDDLTNWGDHILVYDLNKQKPIDFYSVLNYYYASGVEPLPSITFLN
ncbi:hypothetical protein GCM10011391_13500 [Pullulanibacillus camelliae]|uniref:Peptidase C-terminal archaeal/bacterial domain-containing protein n=1 Tax=Pullulanibacillus camelliae TaxID=1707096 RepID=A0A8J2YG05_9BACL|nr:hypothetical protein [Pullulanibacillus camelliae]GGE35999.1 hypothetical protein GCM10011391_13500 [Pullulanibacillus camelliae]